MGGWGGGGGRGGGGGGGRVIINYHNVSNNHMIELRGLTGVGESFCELNFYIVVLFKCKKDRLFIIA